MFEFLKRRSAIEAAAPDRLVELQATIELQAAADDASPATFRSMAYGGGAMVVSGFGETVLDLAGMDIPATFPILADHKNELDSVAGHGRGEIQNGELHASGEIVRTSKAGGTIINLSKAGVPLQASMGAHPLEIRHVRAGEKIVANGREFVAGVRGLKFVTKSKLRELTVTPLGADASTTVNVAAKSEDSSMIDGTLTADEAIKG